MNLKTSVILATFNGEKFLKKQLDSILSQTEQVDEILVFDDKSSDDTINILKEYRNKYSIISIFQNERQLGFALNFWQGLRIANYDIIIFSDQDDIWLPNKVKIIKNTFSKNKDLFSLNTAYELIDSNDKKIKNYKNKRFKDNGKLTNVDFKKFIKSPRYPGMAMAINNEFKDILIRDNENYVYAHDWYINQKAASIGKMFFLNSVTTLYRQHCDNTYGVSTQLGKKDLIKSRKIILKNEINQCLILSVLYKNTKYEKYIQNIIKVNNIREKNICSKSFIKTFLLYIINFRYFSLRGFLGDVYAITKCRL